jgi:hypothetical protein
MQEKQVYEYASIRVVPKVERGEFLNVGVILLCKRKQYLAMKYLLDPGRLSAFSAQLDLEQLDQYLNTWDLICKGGEAGGPIGQLTPAERFRWLVAPRSTIIQSSRIHPGMCADPEAVLEALFRQYVL